MIRIIISDSSHGAAANVGGPVDEAFHTFDIDGAEAELFLREFALLSPSARAYRIRKVVGVEVLSVPSRKETP